MNTRDRTLREAIRKELETTRLQTLDQSQVLRDIRTGLALAQKKTEAVRNFPVISFEDPTVPQQANGHAPAARGLKHAIKSKNVH